MKLRTGIKINVGTTLRMSLKVLDEDNLPHELLLIENKKQN